MKTTLKLITWPAIIGFSAALGVLAAAELFNWLRLYLLWGMWQ